MRTTAREESRTRPSAAARAIAVAITGYRRFISPLMLPHCRFEPSCSTYALQAVQRHGALRGGWLAIRRLSRCHPFHRGGIDPVPAVADKKRTAIGGADAAGRDGRGAPMTSQGACR